MIFKLEIQGEIDETKLAAIATILAGGAVGTTVSTGAPTVPAAAASVASPAPAASVPAVEKPARGKAAKPDAAVEPATVAPAVPPVPTEPPSGGKTVDNVKELVVARCSPDANPRLEVKACMAAVRAAVGPEHPIKKLDDIPADLATACYEAVAAL